MNLTVIGAGYVGLVSGVCLASRGHSVTCVDKRSSVVDRLNRAEPTIHEEGLVELLQAEVIHQQRFRATLDLAEALANADLVLLAVGTPSDDEGRMDSRFLEGAIREVGAWFQQQGRILPLVVKSTVLPGTTDTLVATWLSESSGISPSALQLGMNPEFLREGQAVADFMNPDRIVMGASDPVTAERLRELYISWDCDKLETNPRTAEMIKYANNSLLALQISAANELANLAAAIGGVDIAEVLQGVYLDHRWNPILKDGERANPKILTYLKPGCGFGGSCFPKDVSALMCRGRDLGLPMRIFDAVLEVNRNQPAEVLHLLDQAGPEDWPSRKIGLLGLAFKPDTDDIRESAAIPILRGLLQRGAAVLAHDPVAIEAARNAMPDLPVEWHAQLDSVVRECEVLIIATTWQDFDCLPELLAETEGKYIIDPRRQFSPDAFAGHHYLSIGLTPG